MNKEIKSSETSTVSEQRPVRPAFPQVRRDWDPPAEDDGFGLGISALVRSALDNDLRSGIERFIEESSPEDKQLLRRTFEMYDNGGGCADRCCLAHAMVNAMGVDFDELSEGGR